MEKGFTPRGQSWQEEKGPMRSGEAWQSAQKHFPSAPSVLHPVLLLLLRPALTVQQVAVKPLIYSWGSALLWIFRLSTISFSPKSTLSLTIEMYEVCCVCWNSYLTFRIFNRNGESCHSFTHESSGKCSLLHKSQACKQWSLVTNVDLPDSSTQVIYSSRHQNITEKNPPCTANY